MSAPAELRPFPRSVDEISVERIDERLWQLRLPLAYSADGMVNCWLLRMRDGWCLVDCGAELAPGWDALERALALAGVEAHAIGLLLCTHAHSDHYGLASRVVEASGCELAMAPGPRASADVMRDPPIPWERRLELARWAGVPGEIAPVMARHPGDGGLHPRPRPDRLLGEDDVVDCSDGPWRVVPAPGHSPTQVVLFHERTRRLLSADLLLAGRIPYVEYGYTPDPWAEHVASLARVRALGAEVVLPGHGEATAKVERLFRASSGAIEAAPGRLLASIEQAPQSAYAAMLEVLGPESTFDRRHSALSGAVCVLDRLVAQGAAVAADLDGVRIYHPARPSAV